MKLKIILILIFTLFTINVVAADMSDFKEVSYDDLKNTPVNTNIRMNGSVLVGMHGGIYLDLGNNNSIFAINNNTSINYEELKGKNITVCARVVENGDNPKIRILETYPA